MSHAALCALDAGLACYAFFAFWLALALSAEPSSRNEKTVAGFLIVFGMILGSTAVSVLAYILGGG